MKPSRIPLVTTCIVLAFFYLPIAALVANAPFKAETPRS